MNSRIRAVALGAALLGLLAFGAGTAQAVDPPRALPPADGQFDYQIGGPYTPLSSVRVVSRDRLVSPVDPPGRAVYDVCYINAFQTQPDDITWWEANYPDLLLRGSRGSFVIDGAWGENVLDTRTATKRTRLIAILDSWIRRCAADGFDAIEPDNLDSWTRSDDPDTGAYDELLRQADNLVVMQAMARSAHAAGLAIAQKNTSEIATDLHGYGYDFVIAEECQRYTGSLPRTRECDDFLALYGNLVYEIEYTDYAVSVYNNACTARGSRISVIRRDRNVVPRGRAAYRYSYC